MKTVNTCCKVCKPCPNCYNLDIEKVRQYLYLIDLKISEYNESSICISDWGYACKPVTYDQFEKLIIYKGYINHYYKSLTLGFDSGMCPDEIQSVLEATSKLITLSTFSVKGFSNVTVDDSMFNEWVLENPYCVAWEDWEKSAVKVCPKVGIQVKSVTEACNLLFDVKVDDVFTDNCKFLYTLSIASIAKRKSCVDVNVSNLGTCKVNYEFIVENYDCNFDFDTYVSLLNCNLSHKVITNLLECGVDIHYDVDQLCAEIITKTGKYKLTDVEVNIFDSNVDSDSLSQIIDLDEDDLNLQDIDLLINSYNNSHLINSEINE